MAFHKNQMQIKLHPIDVSCKFFRTGLKTNSNTQNCKHKLSAKTAPVHSKCDQIVQVVLWSHAHWDNIQSYVDIFQK